MPDKPNKQVSGSKDGLALVIGGIVILTMVFAAYNYFSRNKNTEDTSSDQTSVFEEDKSSDESEPVGFTDGSAEEEAAFKTAPTDPQATTQPQVAVNTSQESTSNMWVANNYNKGDIQGSSYTVKSGDTLWEIAEGLYGNGADWVKILGANQAHVGFLANGSQALIVPGQVLVLP